MNSRQRRGKQRMPLRLEWLRKHRAALARDEEIRRNRKGGPKGGPKDEA